MSDDANISDFTLNIRCDNDAFQPDPEFEISRILRELSFRIKEERPTGKYKNLHDANGNIVGTYRLRN